MTIFSNPTWREESEDNVNGSERTDDCNGVRLSLVMSRNVDADSGLLEGLKAGDSIAFNILSERYRPYLLRVAFGVTMNHEDAEDAIQCAFLKVHKYVHSFRGDSQFKTWVTSIAINESRMALRKRKTMVSIDDFDGREGDENSIYYKLRAPDDTPEGNYLKREAGDSLAKLVNKLNKPYREVADLHFLKACSCREIALILGLSQPAVKSRLCRARRALLRAGTNHFRPHLPASGGRNKAG